MQRYEAHLEGVDEENAEIMCASAPNDFKDLHFDHPTSCVNWVSSMATVFIVTDGLFFVGKVRHLRNMDCRGSQLLTHATSTRLCIATNMYKQETTAEFQSFYFR